MGKRIAVTGGIGSGKSTVLSIIEGLGYPVFSCDEIYKEIINEPLYISAIEKVFPSVVKNGKIDRTKLSDIVFSDEKARLRLNSIAHPLIMQALIQKMEQENCALVFAEVPLLFEGNYCSYFSDVIVVIRNKEERIKAVCERDKCSKEEALVRLASQFDYDNEKKLNQLKEQGICILENSQDVAELKEHIESMLKDLKKQT